MTQSTPPPADKARGDLWPHATPEQRELARREAIEALVCQGYSRKAAEEIASLRF